MLPERTTPTKASLLLCPIANCCPFRERPVNAPCVAWGVVARDAQGKPTAYDCALAKGVERK